MSRTHRFPFTLKKVNGYSNYYSVVDYEHPFFVLSHEKYLDAGRFINFSNDVLNNQISLSLINNPDIEPVISWISENINNKWSVHASTMEYCFGFENESDAMHFALRWR